MNMQYSRDGLHLTEGFEQCRLVPYLDSAGILTNGWGNTHGVIPGVPITQAQADADLLENVQNAVNAVNRLVTTPLTQHQFDACVDFVFNAGQGNFASSTLLRDLNDGRYLLAAQEFKRWDMAGGAHLAGLARRRQAEADLFMEPEDHI